MPAIQAVCFDVGGVLTNPVAPAFIERARAADVDPTTLRSALWTAFAAVGDGDEPAHRLERGEITLDDFIDLTGSLAPTVRTLMDPASPFFVPSAFEPNTSMHDFVREVRAMGIKTAIVSNVVQEWLPWWQAVSPSPDLFDVVVHSCTVGMRKPNPSIFQHTLGLLGVDAAATLFLDDFLAMVDAAAGVGMTAIHVGEHAAAIEEARRHLAGVA